MVNAELVDAIARRLSDTGSVFVQTDIEDLADEMFDLFRADDRFVELSTEENPYPVKTEREKAVEDKELPVYRTSFVIGSR
jgi:tRNA G46 methylase TrmB